jgi:gamma-glutamylcyclotransferase (GGCT)/AIG2-like uncharacterized protein YtfP
MTFRSFTPTRVTPVFCYGSLLPMQGRAHVMQDAPCLGPAILQGAELYDLGCFPGIQLVADEDKLVVGMLYEANDALLANLDHIEGYDPKDEEDSFFKRTRVMTQRLADGANLRAQVYVYPGADEEGHIISHGDYRRHLLEAQEEQQWVVAYGSNLDPERITQRLGRMPEARVGTLEDMELIFNKKGDGDNVYANVRFAPHARTPAVAYRLDAGQLATLDACEGTPEHYLRLAVVFTATDGTKELMQAYLAHPDRLLGPYDLQPPHAGYLDHILKGYRHWGLDEGEMVWMAGSQPGVMDWAANPSRGS